MTAKNCFKSKIASGRVSRRAGKRILAIMRDAEARARAGDETAMRAAMDEAATIAAAEATKKQALAAGRIVAQVNVLRGQKAYAEKIDALRATPGALGFGNQAPPGLGGAQSPLGAFSASLLVRDIREVATWNNVFYLATELRKESVARFAAGLDYLRPKALGLAPETAREADVLRALYGHEASPQSRAVAAAFGEEAERLRAAFNHAAGYEAIPHRADWRIGNPAMDQAKVQAWTPEAFGARVATLVDRDKMIDFSTGRPLSDARLADVLRDVYETARLDGAEGQPNAGYVGEGPLSARRSAPRTLMLKGPEQWEEFARLFSGQGGGVLDAMMRHVSSLAHDTAIMRVLGPDPQSTKRFILSLFDRETARIAKTGNPDDPNGMAAAVTANRRAEASVAKGREAFETHWAHMTGEASIPVDAQLAATLGDARHWLRSAQLGSALLSSFADLGTLAATARFDGLPATAVLSRALKGLADGDAEITAAQAGLVADSLVHGVRETDRYMGEVIRSSAAARASDLVNRASGLRRWSSVLRSSFGLEMMARMANAVEAGTAYAALPFREALARYGVDAEQWGEIARVARDGALWEPRAGARFLRPLDLRDALPEAADALGRLLQTEMEFTAIEGDPVTRALLVGRFGRPGEWKGELLRGALMYKTFPLTILLTHGARALARGWNGQRLAHGAFAAALMTLFGMASYQAKQIVAGKDPVSMDAATPEGRLAWMNALLQGGGLGPFGDILLQDKTRYGNSWAAFLGGPLASAAEDVAGQWALKNVQLALQGRETHFLGDALWIGARYVPGSSLWYAKLAFQRELMDQLLILGDDRAHERFARIEERARTDFHQDYWWRRGETAPERAPAFPSR